MLITSLSNDKIKGYIKLKNRKYRKKTKTFLVEGMHLVLEAYKKGVIKDIIIQEDGVVPLNVPTIYVTNEILKALSELETPPNIMAVCNMSEDKEVKGDKILLLDGIQDPGNLGTIIRSAVAFHIDTIVLGPDTVDLYNSKVIRSTQGMIFHINIIEDDLTRVISKLKTEEIPIYGTRVNYGIDVKTLREKDRRRYALVVGNEGSGVSEEVLDICDQYLYIDINENTESLNVAVATSILLYELDR